MPFSNGLLNQDCFQQDKMRKERIKIVCSLLAFECMGEKVLEPILVELNRFLLMLVERKIVPWQLSHGTLRTLEENILKILVEGKLWVNIKNEIR